MTVSVQLIQIPAAETVAKREFYLTGAKMKIGRDYASDICLPDGSESMSRVHLMISRMDDGRYTVTDLSTNGAKLNNEPLVPKDANSICDGDVLSFAGYRLLLGIVENVITEDIVEFEPKLSFDQETDVSSFQPILPHDEIEEVSVLQDREFARSEIELGKDLLFDPFAEGPAIKKSDEGDLSRTPLEGSNEKLPKTTQVSKMLYPLGVTATTDDYSRGDMRRENVAEAMERALEKFLNELDPSVLQEDYDFYIPILANRKKRYWSIHCRQFTKKRSRGEFRRTFMSLFADEVRKL